MPHALITGAASGIGAATATLLAQRENRVTIADLDFKSAQSLSEQLNAIGGRSIAVAMDVASVASVEQGFAEARKRFSSVDILINSAGWDRIEPFVENTPETWERIIDVNLRGTIHCCRVAVDDMMEAKGGKIVSISSDAGRAGGSGEAVYSACKGGVIAFSKALAREMARYQIKVNVICPGPTPTPLLDEVTSREYGAKIIEATKRAVPLRRLGTPEEIAKAVAFFVSSEADFITGQVLSVSGGLTMVD